MVNVLCFSMAFETTTLKFCFYLFPEIKGPKDYHRVSFFRMPCIMLAQWAE